MGRHREVSIILDRLANRHNRGGSAISGPEGIGKTSLLHYVTSDLALKDWPDLSPDVAHFVFMPTHLFTPFSETDFWLYLFSDLQEWLRDKFQDKARRLVEIFEAGEQPGKFAITNFFEDLGKEAGAVVVVMLDGFDLLLEGMRLHDPEDAARHLSFLHTLRGLLNLPAPRGFSLITASERPLFDLFAEASIEARWLGSDFYSNMVTLPLGGFSSEDVDELLTMYLSDTSVAFDKNASELLLEVSHGHPREVQKAAYDLFEKIVATPKGEMYMPIDPNLVKVITGASALLVEIARDVFKARQAKRQAEKPAAESEKVVEPSVPGATISTLPIDQPKELETILQQIDLAGQRMKIDTIESIVTQLSQHKRNWNDFLEEEAKPTASAAARVEAKQLRENEEILIRSKSLSLKQQLEELTGRAIVLPGLE